MKLVKLLKLVGAGLSLVCCLVIQGSLVVCFCYSISEVLFYTLEIPGVRSTKRALAVRSPGCLLNASSSPNGHKRSRYSLRGGQFDTFKMVSLGYGMTQIRDSQFCLNRCIVEVSIIYFNLKQNWQN